MSEYEEGNEDKRHEKREFGYEPLEKVLPDVMNDRNGQKRL